tara:strand:- start:2678 stop:3091 length:414 start_codon:yes stop_codon:yes gene_type:complete
MNVHFNKRELDRVAIQVLEKVPSKILCLHGEMGAGKTTLIKAMVKVLGAAGNANSPTFGIVNEYHLRSGDVLGYHFDCYRLRDENEAWDIGLDEYLISGRWVFIEWPEIIQSLLPDEAVHLYLEVAGNDLERRLTIA